MVLCVLLALAIGGHLVVEAAGAAAGISSGPATHALLTPGCAHTSILLPIAVTLALGRALHFLLAVARPLLHACRMPTLLRPPINAPSF
jgi:hypothetical protein